MTVAPTPPDAPDAAEALQSVRRSREAVAGRLHHPTWYQAAYALGAGAAIAAFALPSEMGPAGASLCALLMLAAHRRWSDRSGIRVRELGPPRARRAAVALSVFLVALILVSLVLQDRGVWWGPLALAPAAALATAFASRQWLRLYRAEAGTPL